MKTLVFLVALATVVGSVSVGCLSQTVEATGTVKGVVLDERGQPVAEATVKAYPTDRGFTYLNRTSTATDGSYEFESLPMGKYGVVAEKPLAFYSLDGFAAGNDVLPPIVELTPNQPTAFVTVRFPGKVAALILNIEDAETGKGTYSCVKLARASDSEKWLRTGTQEKPVRVLVPPNTDLTLTAWYPGYLPHTYSGTLRLLPKEERNVMMKLESNPAAKHKTKDELLTEMKRVMEEGCADK